MKLHITILLAYSIALLPSCKHMERSSSSKIAQEHEGEIVLRNVQHASQSAFEKTRGHKLSTRDVMVVVDKRNGKTRRATIEELADPTLLTDYEAIYVGSPNDRFVVGMDFLKKPHAAAVLYSIDTKAFVDLPLKEKRMSQTVIQTRPGHKTNAVSYISTKSEAVKGFMSQVEKRNLQAKLDLQVEEINSGIQAVKSRNLNAANFWYGFIVATGLAVLATIVLPKYAHAMVPAEFYGAYVIIGLIVLAAIIGTILSVHQTNSEVRKLEDQRDSLKEKYTQLISRM